MTTKPDVNTPLTQEELEELDDFLLSPAVAEDAMTLDELDGFLTALAIGPTTLPLGKWFPSIWGTTEYGVPDFDSTEEMQRIIGLIFRRINSIVDAMETDPDAHEPLFEAVETGDADEPEAFSAESWSMGFMTAVDMFISYWDALFDDPNAREALNPIYLMGGERTPDEEEQVTTLKQCIELSKRIPDSIARIYRFWLPQRQAAMKRAEVVEANVGKTKAGRNDPCPCGSGKKFKKCCGV